MVAASVSSAQHPATTTRLERGSVPDDADAPPPPPLFRRCSAWANLCSRTLYLASMVEETESIRVFSSV